MGRNNANRTTTSRSTIREFARVPRSERSPLIGKTPDNLEPGLPHVAVSPEMVLTCFPVPVRFPDVLARSSAGSKAWRREKSRPSQTRPRLVEIDQDASIQDVVAGRGVFEPAIG